MPALEFGLCGIDDSIKTDDLREILQPQEDAPQKGHVVFVLAFQLAYQGTPDNPSEKYKEGTDPGNRRYNGLVYPAWYEIKRFLNDFPKVPLSFHLNETVDCHYVSDLLGGTEEMMQMMEKLAKEFHARHIQVNLTSDGVPLWACTDPTGEDVASAQKGCENLLKLCRQYPETLFLVPIAQMKRRDGTAINTMHFFQRLLKQGRKQGLPANLVGFFDCSAGTGKEPDAVPQVPEGYRGKFVGFTGGINKDNVMDWLDKYAERAREHRCSLICDAQTGFRENRSRSGKVDKTALRGLVENVREWVARQPADTLWDWFMQSCGQGCS